MRIVFMGTPEFAAPSLRALAESNHAIALVVTRADKPAGRGRRLHLPAVKMEAERLGLPVYQPVQVSAAESLARLREAAPELNVVAAYGQILKPAALAVPLRGSINLHASLLPQYRGAAPIQRAIMAGEIETGLTTIWMDEGTDTGDILLQRAEPIAPEDSYGSLSGRLAERGAELLVETLARVEAGEAPRRPQDSAAASYAPPLTREEARLDWRRPAERLHNLVRATNPAPGAYTFRDGSRLKILHTEIVKNAGPAGGVPGRVTETGQRGFVVETGDTGLLVREVQPENRRVMTAHDYVLGYRLQAGEILA